MSCLLDVVPDAQKSKEPDGQQFGSYCFEELEPAKVLGTISTEVIELSDSSKDSKCSQESRKPVEEGSIIENYKADKKKTQDANSEFQKHSQNSQMGGAVETFEIKFKEKPVEKRILLSGSEF